MELDKTWNMLDSTKLETYMSCPRQYFYRYICGWTPEVDNLDFVFGRAYHAAQEKLLQLGYGLEAIDEAIMEAEKVYRDVFPEETDKERVPKIPAYIKRALFEYVERFEEEDRDTKTIYTEIAGKVPIDSDKGWFLHFKMDSILLKEWRGYFSREHKTASANSRQWRDSFKLKFQIGTYNHVLYCVFPVEEVWGVEINGAIFTKGKGVEFERIPVRKPPRMMEAWLFQACYYYGEYLKDVDLLMSKNWEDESVLDCFQMRPVNCTAYRGCPYIDFCMSWANPCQYNLSQPPEGFVIDFWDPTESRKTAKKILDIEEAK